MQNRKAILLVGSPKPFKSSSENVGKLLLGYLADQGFQTEVENIGIAFRKAAIDQVILKVNSADITIISTPLYVDSIPSSLINFLELFKNDNHKSDKKFIGIVNSGFPESFQNNTAIELLRLFAIHNGFSWVAGYTIGGGGVFGNINLKKSDMAEHIVESFRKSSICLSKNESIPLDVIEKASKPIMPISIYLFFGKLGWYLQSIKYRTLFKLWARPYVS